MSQHPLTIEIRPAAGSVTLVLCGELDLASVGTLRVCLEQLDPGVESIIVDLGGLSFMDSTGLATLIATHQRLAANGGMMALHNPQDHVRRVLEVSGVDQVVPVTSPDLLV